MPLSQDTAVAANRLAAAGLAVSSVAIAYQMGAYAFDCIPDHILPLVRLLSGTQEAVPVAYSWTVLLAVLSTLVFVVSFCIVVGLRFARRRLIPLLAVLPLTLTGCGRFPTGDQIRADFLVTEPHATVLDVRHTEGDSDHIYYEIEFTRGTDSQVMICEIGAKVSDDSRSYTIFHRSTRQKTSP